MTKEDRDRHLAAVANPNVKPVRSTVDLSPVRHRQLKAWCGETAEMIGKSRVTTQDVFRAFVDRLITTSRSLGTSGMISVPQTSRY
jgi:hypothetical protein